MSTYYTKCGLEFKKSTKATVTGYKVDESNQKCSDCDFKTEVTKGYPAVFDHWECRAGSEKPNHNTDWTGNLDDKNTISINSLNHEFMEEVRLYCKELPDISASYNTDHLADCRRTLSISCSSNKKGIAAKKALIEKFFPKNIEEKVCPYFGGAGQDGKKLTIKCGRDTLIYSDEGVREKKINKCFHDMDTCRPYLFRRLEEIGEVPQSDHSTEELREMYLSKRDEIMVNEDCTTCTYVKDSDEAGKVNCSENPNEKPFKPKSDCMQYNPDKSMSVDDLSTIETSENVLEKEYPNCDQDECPFNNSNGGCCFEDEDPQSYGYNSDVFEAVDGYGCKTAEVLKQYGAITNTDFTDYTIDAPEDELASEQPEKKKPRIGTESGCIEMKEDCPCFCSHNDGCSVLLLRGSALKSTIKNMYSKYNIACNVYRKVAEKLNGGPESEDEIANVATNKSGNIKEFDYSTVDADTAEFLQEKSKRITEIRVKLVIDLGRELKEVHDRLANHYQGCFGKWCDSIGISRDTGNNYIRAYDYVAENFGNLTDAEKLQPSLLFAVSKPSAPKELQEKVLSGDITTHKQYKEKEDEWKKKIEELRSQQNTLREEKQQATTRAFDAERRADRLVTEIDDLNNRIDELKTKLPEEEDTELIFELQTRISELEAQLKDKPIEAAAVEVVEKVPEKDAAETAQRLYGTLLAAKLISKTDIQIVHDTASFEKREAIIEFLENLRDLIPRYLDILYESTEG